MTGRVTQLLPAPQRESQATNAPTLLSPTPLLEDITLFVAFVQCFEAASSSVTQVGLKLRPNFLPQPSGVEWGETRAPTPTSEVTL